MRHAFQRMAENPHDRIAWVRDDPAELAARWADPRSKVLVVAGNRIRSQGGNLEWLPTSEAPEGIQVLLGESDGVTYFAVLRGSADAGEDWVGIREIFDSLLGESVLGPLVLHAIGIAEWHRATRHCAHCGGKLKPHRAAHELHCTDCARPSFPRSDPAVIMLITHGEPGSEQERCLLGRQATWPVGRYSTLAGFCEPGETLEDAVRREVFEETHVQVGDIRYFGSQGWPLPASLMVGYVGRATTTEIKVDPTEIEDAQWFTRAELKAGTESGAVLAPSGVSISRALIEDWFGGPLRGSW